jgi:hypothetical protein
MTTSTNAQPRREILITLFWLSDMALTLLERNSGSSRILGALSGENRDISDLQEV